MVSLTAGIDISGKPRQGNHIFMGIVIGTQEKINFIANQFDLNQNYHKNNANRNDIISALKFDGKEIIGFCIRIDKEDIIEKLKNKKIKNRKQSKNKKIHLTYNRILFQEIRKNIEAFTHLHNNAISDVIFECDNDCIGFLKDNGIHHTYKGKSHILSDIVAWANNRGLTSHGIIEMDCRENIHKKMKKG